MPIIPKPLRDLARRLPVIREPEVQRALAQMGAATRTCARCCHFDYAAGQKQYVISESPNAQAARHLSPAQMLAGQLGAAAKGELDPEDDFKPTVGAENPLAGVEWKDAGLCRHHQALVFRPHGCEDWG